MRDNALVKLRDGDLSAVVNAGQGGDVLSLVDRSLGEVLWQSPRRRDENELPATLESDPSSFYDAYPGGIQELFPNTADSTRVLGAELPFHGEACRVPWRIVSDGIGETQVTLVTTLRRYPVRMRKSIRLDAVKRTLRIDSEALNVGNISAPYSWAFHPTFGQPFLGTGSRVELDADFVTLHPTPFSSKQRWGPGATVPLEKRGLRRSFPLLEPNFGGAELAYAKVKTGEMVLSDGTGAAQIKIRWNAELMPHVWIWQESNSTDGYPWFGREHVVGLEVHTHAPALPLDLHVQADMALYLEPNASAEAWIEMAVCAPA